MRFFYSFLGVLVFGWLIFLYREGWAQEETAYRLATSHEGGTSYPVGVALATLMKAEVLPSEGFGLSVTALGGSFEALDLLSEDEFQFVIVRSLDAYHAREGKGLFSEEAPLESLRSVTSLWPSVLQFVVSSSYAKTGTVRDMEDLKGALMAMGDMHSGRLEVNRFFLGRMGIDMEKDYRLSYGGYEGDIEDFLAGRVVGMGLGGGVPTAGILSLFSQGGERVTLLTMGSQDRKRFVEEGFVWRPYRIEAGTYPHQAKPVETVAQYNILGVREDVSAYVVYRFVKAIYENISVLEKIYPIFSRLNLRRGLEGLSVPLHEGALRYYRERGVAVPQDIVENPL
jgi:TRAP transporter TAXI family solute receptor